jgi:hypothetical protein
MSKGRIDVVATPTEGGIYVSLESFEDLAERESLSDPAHGQLKAGGGVIWTAALTRAEARYLRDELTGALERGVVAA